MAAYGTSATNSANAASSVTITKPTSLAVGDLLVAIIIKNETGSSNVLTTPTNWTRMDTAISGAQNQIEVYSKVADSADVAASNFTFGLASGTANLAGVLYRITGTFSSPTCVYAIDAGTGSNEVNNTPDTHQIGGITPTVASSLLISFLAGLQTGGACTISTYEIETSNPTWTERADFTAGSYVIGSATATRTEVTATGYVQFTFSGNNNISSSEGLGVILAIADTVDSSTSPSVLASALAVQAPSLIISSTIDPAVITATLAVQAPTTTTAAPLWTNTDKPSPGSIANTDKP